MSFIVACTKKPVTKQFEFKPMPCVITDSNTNGNCIDTFTAGVDAISGPTTCAVNTTIQLQITSVGLNGCANFPIITQTTNGNAIQLQSKIAYAGCICTQAFMPVSNIVNFILQNTGTYVFTRVDFNSNIITHTIIVY